VRVLALVYCSPEGIAAPSLPVCARNVRSWLELITVPCAESSDLRAAYRLLATLPRRQRAVLVLRYYEDMSEDQIAQTLGCAPGTVKSQASKALAKLRAALEADQELKEATWTS